MPAERLRQLQKFYEEDPGDPFNLYALALEYLKTDSTKTSALFDVLLHQHPSYLPTYYHAAKLCQDMGQHGKAVKIFEEGMALAKRINDTKALRELRAAYDEMMFE